MLIIARVSALVIYLSSGVLGAPPTLFRDTLNEFVAYFGSLREARDMSSGTCEELWRDYSPQTPIRGPPVMSQTWMSSD